MIRWITDRIGTAAHGDADVGSVADAVVVDVRQLVDRGGNRREELEAFIAEAAAGLRDGRRVVVCCDMGISRSNAIAIGALASTGTPVDDAIAAYLASGSDAAIEPGLLREIRVITGGPATTAGQRDAVLLLGGAGYIGSRLAQALDPDRVLILDRDRFELPRDVIAVDRVMREGGVGTVVHLAHPRLRNDPRSLGEATALMRGVLELCHLNGAHLVYGSALAVYDGLAGDHVAHPELPALPRGVYGESKHLCEELVRLHGVRGRAHATVLRLGLVYGPGQRATTFLAKFFEWARAGQPIRTHRYRNGEPAFDFVHVDDVVRVLRLAIDKGPRATVHVGTGRLTSTADLARAVVRIVGSSSPHELVEIDDDVARTSVDPAEAASVLGWRSAVDLDDGLSCLWKETT